MRLFIRRLHKIIFDLNLIFLEFPMKSFQKQFINLIYNILKSPTKSTFAVSPAEASSSTKGFHDKLSRKCSVYAFGKGHV